MPRLRALIASVLGGLIVFAVIGFWLHWPMYLSVTLAALLGVVFLMMAAALDDDGVAADAAWRAAAADLLGGDRVVTTPAGAAHPAVATDTAAAAAAIATEAPGESTSRPRDRANNEPDYSPEPDAGPLLAPEPVGPGLRVESEAEP
jgi:predicted lipid-binding transport protein (Tim44 family)